MKPKTYACKKCKVRKDFNKTQFGLAASNSFGLSLTCRACANKKRRTKSKKK